MMPAAWSCRYGIHASASVTHCLDHPLPAPSQTFPAAYDPVFQGHCDCAPRCPASSRSTGCAYSPGDLSQSRADHLSAYSALSGLRMLKERKADPDDCRTITVTPTADIFPSQTRAPRAEAAQEPMSEPWVSGLGCPGKPEGIQTLCTRHAGWVAGRGPLFSSIELPSSLIGA